MPKIYNNLKAILTLCAALTIPTILPAATSFASISPVETKSAVDKSESLATAEQEEDLAGSEQLCVDTNFGRTRLKELLQDTRKVVLTFDDGPHPTTTPYILDILKKRNIKAIFFVLGLQANKYPELVKRIHDEGHIVGNHTYGHKNLAAMSPTEIKKEIMKSSNLIEKITGEKPTFLRPPYGACNKKVIATVNEAGMHTVLWTVDTRDWKSKNEKSILSEVDRQLAISKGNFRGGAILMHDIYPSTVRALGPVLDKLASNDYKVAAINNLGNTEAEFWSVKAPVISKNYVVKHINPEVSGNPFMISILKEKKKTKPSHMAMLKAQKEGNLIIFLTTSGI